MGVGAAPERGSFAVHALAAGGALPCARACLSARVPRKSFTGGWVGTCNQGCLAAPVAAFIAHGGWGVHFREVAWVAPSFTESCTSPRWKAARAWGGGGRRCRVTSPVRRVSVSAFVGQCGGQQRKNSVVCIGRQEMFRTSVGSCPVFPPRLIGSRPLLRSRVVQRELVRHCLFLIAGHQP